MLSIFESLDDLPVNQALGYPAVLKVIRKLFLNHNKSYRWHLGDYDFFSF